MSLSSKKSIAAYNRAKQKHIKNQGMEELYQEIYGEHDDNWYDYCPCCQCELTMDDLAWGRLLQFMNKLQFREAGLLEKKFW